MATCYPFYKIPVSVSAVQDATGDLMSSKVVYWFEFPDQVQIEVAKILSKFNYDPIIFFHLLEDQCRRIFKRNPWAIILFRDEYPLAGHLMSIRPDSTNIRFSSYTIARDSIDLSKLKNAPPISFLWVFSKEALEQTASYRSPMINDVWRELSGKSEDDSWVVIADDFDKEWVKKETKKSEELFFEHYNPR